MSLLHFVYPFICWWASELFLPFWLLWVMLLWTWVYKYLFKSLSSVIFGIYSEVKLLDNLILFNFFAELPSSFQQWLHRLNSYQQCSRVPISSNPCQWLLLSVLVCLFLSTAILMCIKYCGFDLHFPDD